MTLNLIKTNSRSFLLLVSILSLIIGCKTKDKDSVKNIAKSEVRIVKNDSLIISIDLPSGTSTGLSILDRFDNPFLLSFKNTGKNDSVITKKILNPHQKQVIKYFHGILMKDTILNFKHNYYVDKTTSYVKFKYDKGDLFLKDYDGKIKIIDSMVNAYEKLRLSIFRNRKSKSIHEANLDSLYSHFNTSLQSEPYLMLNKIEYLNKLNSLDPFNKDTEKFLKNLKSPLIAYSPGIDGGSNGLRYRYIKKHISEFEFDSINSNIQSPIYMNELAIGMFGFLRAEKNKGDSKYNTAIDWLKTTELFKKYSNYIDKIIKPIDKYKFKESIKEISFFDIDGQFLTIKEIINEKSNNYYLLDFWATWCIPCIKGIDKMKTMKMPQNVTIISVSIDDKKDKENWKMKSNELELFPSLWIDGKNEKTKSFLRLVKLQSIPRYILIDKNLNIIDESFHSPFDPQFLSKLKDIENYKYW